MCSTLSSKKNQLLPTFTQAAGEGAGGRLYITPPLTTTPCVLRLSVGQSGEEPAELFRLFRKQRYVVNNNIHQARGKREEARGKRQEARGK